MKKDLIVIGTNVFETIVALTEEEQRKGLMYKSWPPPVMIFPYKKAGVRKFWMKNTSSPLDIIFCKSNQIVGIFKGNPYTTTLVGPNKLIDLVIELPFGTVAEKDINIGDSVEVKYSLATIARQIDNPLTA